MRYWHTFGLGEDVKRMIDHKLISLVLGIAVALVIMLTVWSNRSLSAARQKHPHLQTSPFSFSQPEATLTGMAPFTRSTKYAPRSRWIHRLLFYP